MGQQSRGLTAAGSTRSWRKARENIKGPRRCYVCGTTRNLQADHKRARKDGGTDNPGNLRWCCVKHQNAGRPPKVRRRTRKVART